jgi:FkbM family methyltransferase
MKQRIKTLIEAIPFISLLFHRYRARRGQSYFLKAQRLCFEKILVDFNIDTLIDVGAHQGETALFFRKRLSFQGEIFSFEPISNIFQKLQTKAKQDPLWHCFPTALGQYEEARRLQIFNNAYNSSFLSPHTLLTAEGKLKTVAEESVQVQPLDHLYPSLIKPDRSVLLKIDTQGFEMAVLQGALQSLSKISLIKMEVSLRPLYQGETTMGTIVEFLQGKGFFPILIEPGHLSPTRYQLQADIVFCNQEKESALYP